MYKVSASNKNKRISSLILLKKSFHVKSYFFLSHFFKTLALKISGVNGGKKNIFISTYVEYYGEQGHMHFLIIHWEIRAADAKKYFFEGHTVYVLKIG